jgi:hypothetical protein
MQPGLTDWRFGKPAGTNRAITSRMAGQPPALYRDKTNPS